MREVTFRKLSGQSYADNGGKFREIELRGRVGGCYLPVARNFYIFRVHGETVNGVVVCPGFFISGDFIEFRRISLPWTSGVKMRNEGTCE